MRCTTRFLLAGILIARTAYAASTNAVWDLPIPFLTYSNAPWEKVFVDLERVSAEVDPHHHGIRVLWSKWPDLGRFTGSTSNRTFGGFFRGRDRIHLYDNVAIVLWEPDGPRLGVAGVFGKCLDADTGVPITNVTFKTCTIRTKHRASPFETAVLAPSSPPARAVVAPDGGFVLAIPYFSRDALFFSDPESQPLTKLLGPTATPVTAFEVSAPGYITQTNRVDIYHTVKFPFTIKMKTKNSNKVPGHGP